MLVWGLVRSKSMPDKPKNSSFSGSGLLIVLSIAAGMLLTVVGPTSAQFFNFGGYQQQPQRGGGWYGGGWFGNGTFDPYQRRVFPPRQARPPVREDFSRAPPPEKRETAPERHILVLGDSMADWLAYGLEDAYAEQPDTGVIRKAKNTSGLIKYQPKGEPANWAAAAKGILATEKPDVIVVMLGLNDRVAIREPVTEKRDKPIDKKSDKEAHAKGDGKSDGKGGVKSEPKPEAARKPEVDTELPQDDADNARVPPQMSPRSPNGLYEFREDRWVELYSKKIEEMIAAVKSKGVPVIWVGLPAISGSKGTSDMLFLDSIYREVAGRTGITYVDVWDGFVDEHGLFQQKGPTSKARSANCVLSTASSSRKQARASWLTSSSARSPGCSRHARSRSRCRPSPRRLTSTRCPASPPHVRWRGRFCH